jgi:hypothetical protein
LESLLEGLLKNNEDGTASIENSRHSDSADDTFEDAETTSYIDRNITDAPLMSALNDAIVSIFRRYANSPFLEEFRFCNNRSSYHISMAGWASVLLPIRILFTFDEPGWLIPVHSGQ